ncbi:DUF11 domain-containing protein [Limibacillus halophilus]
MIGQGSSTLTLLAIDKLGRGVTYNWAENCGGTFLTVEDTERDWDSPTHPDDGSGNIACDFTVELTAEGADTEVEMATVTVMPSNVTGSDISLRKSVSNDIAVQGDDVLFTLTAVNNGPDPASSVVINDQALSGAVGGLADNFTVRLVSGNGTFDAITGNWTITDLAVGSATQLELVATLDLLGDLDNEVSITSVSGDGDPNDQNDSDSVTVESIEENSIEIIQGPDADPDSHVIGGIFSISALAEDALGLGVTYEWALLCDTLGTGFLPLGSSGPEIVWVSPSNNSPDTVENCTAILRPKQPISRPASMPWTTPIRTPPTTRPLRPSRSMRRTR